MTYQSADHAHGHIASHAHATIDHLASEQASSLALLIRLDQQLMLDLGVKDMILLTDTPEKKIVALEGYDLNIVGTHAIRGTAKDGGA